ncbi:MAG: A24 family peptidase C-terminal domain-containing protein [Candidatus Thermoplasmatota archaeon]
MASLVLLDLLRLLVGATLLAFGATTDWFWRRAPNALWLVMASAGAMLILIEAVVDSAPWAARWPYLLALPVLLLLATESSWGDIAAAVLGLGGAALAFYAARSSPESLTTVWPYLAAIPIFAGVIYAFWYFGLIAGGADAKALMALAVLLPFPITLADGVPRFASVLPSAFTVLGNTLLFFLVIPLGMLVWNVAHGDVRFPHAFLGLKREARQAGAGHAWPMEVVDAEGKRSTRLFASRMSASEADEAIERIQALGNERVWVSPKIPFLVPMLLGFLAAFTLGDVMFALVDRALGHA